MGDPDGGYPALLARLVAARAGLDAREAEVHAWYDAQVAAADAAVARAAGEVAAARDALAAARDAVHRVDTEAALLWRALRTRVGVRAAARLGELPAPVPPGDLPVPGTDPGAAGPAAAPGDRSPTWLLRGLRDRLDATGTRRGLPRWLRVLLAVLAAAALAAVAVVLARAS